jgi:hypothetical protein
MKIDWRAVLRDALGVLLLGFLGVLIGKAIGSDSGGGIRITSAIVMMTAGFCVSGCLAKQARFKHLALVAVAVWLIGMIVSAVSADWSFVLSLSDIALIAASMLLGGLISLAIVKPPPAAPQPPDAPPADPPPA